MPHRILLLVVTAILALALSSCGRSTLGDHCSSDSDCGAFFCVDGFCVDEPDENEEENNETNNADLSCEVDDDCEGPGESCEDGECVLGPDNNVACEENEQGICVREVDDGIEICEVGCPPTRVQIGCDCLELECQTSDECDAGLVCVEGFCGACKEDLHCPENAVCTEGLCVEGEACDSDVDCLPSERCAPDGVCRPRNSCLFDDQCRQGEICFNGTCTVAPECQVDLDCPEGQECVGGNCFVALCRGSGDCEDGQICDAGECVDPPDVVECMVVTPDQTITEGQRVPLEAFAFDANGTAVAASFDWVSTDPPVAAVVSGPAALGGEQQGSATLTASADTDSVGEVACIGSAVLTNPGAVMPDTIRVFVTDIESGAPVSDATVQIAGTTEATDASGVALLPDPAGDYSVSVFHQDFNWLTVHGVSERDIRLPLHRQTGTGDIGGFTGEFDTSMLHTSGNITLGLAGASLAGGLLDLDLGRLLGDTFVSRLEIPGVVDEDIPLPGGLVAYGGALGFMIDLKRTYYAKTFGGPRIAWGLAGELPFTQLLDFFQDGNFEGTEVLSQLLPLFNRFDHGAHPDVFDELPFIVDVADIDGDGDTSEMVPDYGAFPVIDLQPNVRQNLVTEVGISNFPVLANGTTDFAILVGGVMLDSPGFVPTGISATGDEDGDGRPDLQRLSIAPAYGPLVGGRYGIVAITFGGGGGGPVGPGGFELPSEFSVALWSGQNFPTSLSLGTFPDGSMGSVDEQNRQIAVNSHAGPLFRVRMIGESRTWDVWSVGPPGVMGQFGDLIDVPGSPVSAVDLFLDSQVYVDAIQTNVNLDDLVAASGLGLRRAGLVASAYNRTRLR